VLKVEREEIGFGKNKEGGGGVTSWNL